MRGKKMNKQINNNMTLVVKPESALCLDSYKESFDNVLNSSISSNRIPVKLPYMSYMQRKNWYFFDCWYGS